MVRRGQPNRERGKALPDALRFALPMPHRLAAVQPPEADLRMDLKDLPVRARVFEQHAIDLHNLLADSPGLSGQAATNFIEVPRASLSNVRGSRGATRRWREHARGSRSKQCTGLPIARTRRTISPRQTDRNVDQDPLRCTPRSEELCEARVQAICQPVARVGDCDPSCTASIHADGQRRIRLVDRVQLLPSNRRRRRHHLHRRRQQRRRVGLPRHPGVDHVGPLLQHVTSLLCVLGLVIDTAR